jgi:hypothetical protein
MPTYPPRGTDPYDVALRTFMDGSYVHSAAVASGTGIDPTGVADSSAAIQALIDGLGANGGRVVLPQGIYLLNTGLSTTAPNVEICGEGGQGQDAGVGRGATRLHYAGSGVAFTFNAPASSTIYRGPVLRNLAISGTSSATMAVRFNRTNNWRVENVTISEFSGAAATAFLSDGTGNVNQYGTIANLVVSACTNGIDLVLSNGVRIFGGYLQGFHGAIVAGSFGIRHQSGDTLRVYGTDVQAYARLVDIQTVTNDELYGLRGEDWTVAASSALRIAGANCAVFGGSLNNTLNGSTGTAIEVTAAATNTYLRPANIATGTTVPPVTDAGTNTNLQHPGRTTFAKATRGGTNITVNSVTYIALDAALDLTLTGCLTGEWIEVNLSMQVNNEAVALVCDAQTIVSGSPVNGIGQQNSGTPLPTSGIQAWLGPASAIAGIGGSVLYQLQAGDIVAGAVTLRVMVRTISAVNKTVLSGAANPIIFWARNHGRG